MTWTKPGAEAIRKALAQYAPSLGTEPIEFLGEGWSCWAFRARDHVLRFPKSQRDSTEFDTDRRLLPELVRYVSLPIPVPEVYGEEGRTERLSWDTSFCTASL
jgi:aminoglycoside phosphotransferase (APT) family kinase protein